MTVYKISIIKNDNDSAMVFVENTTKSLNMTITITEDSIREVAILIKKYSPNVVEYLNEDKLFEEQVTDLVKRMY